MPFTPAHAAAAIPFQRTPLVTSALVIGCFSPDFEYFLRLAPKGGFGHTVAGMFAFDLPVSLLVFWSFQANVRVPISAWLPRNVRERLPTAPRFSIRSLREVILVCVSIIIGAATHILWDSFTHPRFWPYRHWEFLRRRIQLPIVGSVQTFKLLQHVSTAVGLIALLIWFWCWYRDTAPIRSQDASEPGENARRALLFLCIAALVSGLLRGLVGVGIPINIQEAKIFLAEAGITTITVFWFAVLAYGIFRTRRHPTLKSA